LNFCKISRVCKLHVNWKRSLGFLFWERAKNLPSYSSKLVVFRFLKYSFAIIENSRGLTISMKNEFLLLARILFGNAAVAAFLKNLNFFLLKFNMICMFWIVLIYWCQKWFLKNKKTSLACILTRKVIWKTPTTTLLNTF
jgi:hypothetical protein